MKIEKVGVVGCGLMGHGIVQVAAQGGLPGGRPRDRAGVPREGPRACRQEPRQAGGQGRREGQDDPGAGGRLGDRDARPHHGEHRPCGPRGLRPRRRGHRREPRRQEGAVRRPRRDLQARDHLRLEHLVVPDRGDGGCLGAPGALRRPALLQPRPAHAPGRGRSDRRHRRRRLRGREGLRRRVRQDPGLLQGHAGLRREPPARSLHGPGDPDARSRGRERRRHRRGHAVRMRLPHGSHHPDRLRRPRHHPLHPRGLDRAHPDEPAFAIPQSLRDKVAEGKLGRKTGEGYYKWDGDKKA